MFSCEFGEISKNTFLTEHLWATASQATPKKHLNLNSEKKISNIEAGLQRRVA